MASAYGLSKIYHRVVELEEELEDLVVDTDAVEFGEEVRVALRAVETLGALVRHALLPHDLVPREEYPEFAQCESCKRQGLR